MAQFSFDIVSEYDKAEMNNVFDQVVREIQNRYDFKGTPAQLEWLNGDKTGFKVTGNGEWQIDAILDIVRKKLAARGLSQKVLDVSRAVAESNLKATKEVPFVQGLNQDKAKKVTKLLQSEAPKVKAQIQGETVRVTGAKKDELQAAIALLKAQDFDFALQFTNYR
ncbi:MAG TPA: YajQ family cyclic di-GMP-binding protein [Candidatus Saccharimonadales bacterium]|nr:YajQ family cyclic di-GMP-binding protein [Candidatus Saccharimonadales bacterium]